MTNVVLPLTGTTGASNATVATETLTGAEYQYMKLVSGAAGSSVPIPGSTAPSSGDVGLVVRTLGSSAGTTGLIGSVALMAGSSANTIGTVVNATSTSQIGSVALVTGNTGLMGSMALATGTTAVVGTVGLSSGTQTIGTVQLASAGTTGSIGSVALLAGSSATVIGQVAISTANTQTLGAGSSASVIGQVAISTANALYLGLGTSATYQFMQSIPFSSGNVARSSVSTTVDIQIIAANANRKALVVANRSTTQTVGIGFSTAVLTTALANVDLFIGPSSYISFGLHGGLPLYLGPLRGLNLTSTTVAGSIATVEFT